MSNGTDTVKVETRLPEPLRDAITQIVTDGYYMTDSALMRDAIRRLVCEEYGVELGDRSGWVKQSGVDVSGLEVVEEQNAPERWYQG